METETENKAVEDRTEKLLDMFKQNKLLSAFVIIAALSLLFSALVAINVVTYIIGAVSPLSWLLLAIASAISAGLVYAKKDNFSFYPLAAWIAWLAFEIRTSTCV